jgi:cell wall-associated NlpC family hydrolase
MNTTESEQRNFVVKITKSWIGTPYIPGGAVKGAGIDCGMLLICVFQEAGLLDPTFDPRPYPIQWHFHQAAERYLGIVQRFAHEIPPDSVPLPGDIVLFKFGKCFSHGAIVTEWPDVVHAMRPLKVGTINVLNTAKIHKLERRLFTVWPRT